MGKYQRFIDFIGDRQVGIGGILPLSAIAFKEEMGSKTKKAERPRMMFR
ncbi:hypothetical protein [Domibacillus enclensis]|nr:hypothetical protein [Domibacillus enclensis]